MPLDYDDLDPERRAGSSIFIAVFALSITLGIILATAQPSASRSQANTDSSPPHQQTTASQQETSAGQEAAELHAQRQDQSEANWWMVKLTGIIMIFTAGLTVIGLFQWLTHRDTLAANQEIERGYAVISHQPTGFHQQPDGGRWHVRLEVRNSGNTPLAIDHGAIRAVVDADTLTTWPEARPDESRIPGGFLVRDKHYFVETLIALNPEEVAHLQMGRMWLIGWIVYVDAFGVRHRAGYARYVHPTKPGNNLVWDRVSARHNYDNRIDEHAHPIYTWGQQWTQWRRSMKLG